MGLYLVHRSLAESQLARDIGFSEVGPGQVGQGVGAVLPHV